MPSKYDYDRWPNFTKSELICRHTGDENPNVELFTSLMDDVQILRTSLGVSFGVTSAYRSEIHPREIEKQWPGQHTIAAIDIQVSTIYVHQLMKEAFALGFTGIGVNLIGSRNSRFIHLDKRTSGAVVWSY